MGAGTLTEDGWYYGRRGVLRCVQECGPDAVLVDMPHQGPKDDVLAKLKNEGYRGGSMKVRATDFGDSVAKVKVIVYAVPGAGEGLDWPKGSTRSCRGEDVRAPKDGWKEARKCTSAGGSPRLEIGCYLGQPAM